MTGSQRMFDKLLSGEINDGFFGNVVHAVAANPFLKTAIWRGNCPAAGCFVRSLADVHPARDGTSRIE
jgi:hypothetical protein